MTKTHLRKGGDFTTNARGGVTMWTRCGRQVAEAAIAPATVAGQRLPDWQVSVSCQSCRQAASRERVGVALTKIGEANPKARFIVLFVAAFVLLIGGCTTCIALLGDTEQQNTRGTDGVRLRAMPHQFTDDERDLVCDLWGQARFDDRQARLFVEELGIGVDLTTGERREASFDDILRVKESCRRR